MPGIQDVAAYILTKAAPMSAMKLQKLCYYAQSWHLVWDEEGLFPDRIEAWANGPVAPALYRLHRGRFEVDAGDIPGDPDALDSGERATVDAVLGFYGDKSAHWLSELTHREPPWRQARGDLQPGERGSAEITRSMMAEYYSSLLGEDDE